MKSGEEKLCTDCIFPDKSCVECSKATEKSAEGVYADTRELFEPFRKFGEILKNEKPRP